MLPVLICSRLKGDVVSAGLLGFGVKSGLDVRTIKETCFHKLWSYGPPLGEGSPGDGGPPEQVPEKGK